MNLHFSQMYACIGLCVFMWALYTVMQTKMHDRCIQEETPVSNGDMKSVVEGLSPPFVGEIAIQHMQKHVLVSDAEIIEATRMLYSVGSDVSYGDRRRIGGCIPAAQAEEEGNPRAT